MYNLYKLTNHQYTNYTFWIKHIRADALFFFLKVLFESPICIHRILWILLRTTAAVCKDFTVTALTKKNKASLLKFAGYNVKSRSNEDIQT